MIARHTLDKYANCLMFSQMRIVKKTLNYAVYYVSEEKRCATCEINTKPLHNIMAATRI
jgi:hypothetical protein